MTLDPAPDHRATTRVHRQEDGREHDLPAVAAVRADPSAGKEAAGHPLLELQRQVGNAAVVQLVNVQRHALNPEDEAGA